MEFNSSSLPREALVCSNLSNDTVTDIFKVPEAFQPYTLSLVASYMLYQLVGLPWNLLVIGTILKQKLYLQPTIILLLNLVVTDCLILLLPLSVRVISGVAGELILGDTDRTRCEVCRAELILRIIINVSAVLTIAVIAFDRFFFIHKPLRYEKLVSVKISVGAVAVIWLFCIFFVSVHMGLLQNVFIDRPLLQCAWNIEGHPYFHIFSLLLVVVPYVFLLGCNVWVVVIVLRNIRKVYKVQKSKSELRRASVEMMNRRIKKTRSKKQLRLMRVFGAIIVTNTLSSLPTAILAVFSFPYEHSLPAAYVTIATILFYSQTVIHPILESTLIVEIRHPLLKMLSSVVRCKTKHTAHLPSNEKDNKQDGGLMMSPVNGNSSPCDTKNATPSGRSTDITPTNESTIPSNATSPYPSKEKSTDSSISPGDQHLSETSMGHSMPISAL